MGIGYVPEPALVLEAGGAFAEFEREIIRERVERPGSRTRADAARGSGDGGRWSIPVDEMGSRGFSGRAIAKTVRVLNATVRRILRGSRVSATKAASPAAAVAVSCV